MIHMQNPKQLYIFDPWSSISPKRRKMLDDGWPGLFREHILPSIPVDKFAKFFDEYMGRSTKELYSMLGALILQQAYNRLEFKGRYPNCIACRCKPSDIMPYSGHATGKSVSHQAGLCLPE